MQALLNTAVQAARKAGDTAAGYFNRADRLEIRSKARNEFVTQVDEACEAIIIDSIREYYPDHAFLAEESGSRGRGDNVWIIDPLDGTTNFVHGFPVFAVSIALQVRGVLEVSVVYDPMRQELFTAERGRGAQLDGRRIRVSSHRGLEGALIGTGFPYRNSSETIDHYLSMLRSVLTETAGVRRPGAAALDLAYLAAGRLDGFWEFGLKPWDMAGGVLLVQEAGGLLSDIDGRATFMESGNIIGATPKVYAPLMELLTASPKR